MTTATLEELLVYPIKSLDATALETARIVENGGLEWDRRYAIVDTEGEYVNGKRERQIHRLRASYDIESGEVTLSEDGVDDTTTFHLEDDRDELAAWLSAFVGYEVELVRDDEGGFPDDSDASGPTVIATKTLEALASWYDRITATEMRRRLRPNLVVRAADAFWEDRLYDRPGRVVSFDIGSVDVRGVNPCQRCVVPSRDPNTGEETDGFRERFLERREATLPAWASEEWFDHYFRVMVNTRVPESSWGESLEVGAPVSISGPVDDSSV